jgi:hypothetical protein
MMHSTAAMAFGVGGMHGNGPEAAAMIQVLDEKFCVEATGDGHDN